MFEKNYLKTQLSEPSHNGLELPEIFYLKFLKICIVNKRENPGSQSAEQVRFASGQSRTCPDISRSRIFSFIVYPNFEQRTLEISILS